MQEFGLVILCLQDIQVEILGGRCENRDNAIIIKGTYIYTYRETPPSTLLAGLTPFRVFLELLEEPLRNDSSIRSVLLWR